MAADNKPEDVEQALAHAILKESAATSIGLFAVAYAIIQFTKKLPTPKGK